MPSRTLLLPCGGKSSRYPGVRPKWMLTLPDGTLALKRAAESVAVSDFDRTVIAVRADHEERYGCRTMLRRAFGPDAEVLVLPGDTRGPADTVSHMIRYGGVSGRIAVKDADSFFRPKALPEGNFVAVCDVRTAPQMTHVGAKCFAVLNEDGLVVQMVEKSLVSNFVGVGLYGFSDAGLFQDHFTPLFREVGEGEIFVSHVLNCAILEGEAVSAHSVEDYVDVGTLGDWRRFVRMQGIIVCDLDGVVFENHSAFVAPYWDDPDKPIGPNVAVLLDWLQGGAQLIFVTARPEACRAKTEAALAELGLGGQTLVMGCKHGRRFLVNDHAPSNPFPAAVGISIPRNTPCLGDYLAEWR